MTRPAYARAAFALLVVATASAISPTGSRVEPDAIANPAPSVCGTLVIAARAAGQLHEFRLVSHRETRNTSSDETTVLALMSLAHRTGERLNMTDVINFTQDTEDVCATNVTSVVDARSLLSALALAEPGDELPSNASLFFRTHAHREHSVTADIRTVTSALAFADGSGAISWRDVASIEDRNSTTFELDRHATTDASHAIADLAAPNLGAH